MRNLRTSLRFRGIAAVAAIVAAGCAGGGATSAAHDVGQAPLAGGMDEAAFAALHVLRADTPGAPAPSGRTVVLEDVGSSAYLSLPPGRTGPVPGVVVIHEWWGLNDHIRRWADRLAAEGYAALAVDLYDGRVADTRETASALVKSVREDRATAVLAAAHRFLGTSEVRAPRTAVVGWCFGGGWSLRSALDLPELDAAVVYYGQPILDRERLSRLGCPLLAIFGSRDGSIPLDKVRSLDETLTTLGKPHTVLVLDAEHAFANPSSPRYASAPAQEAWEAVRTFLAQHLR